MEQNYKELENRIKKIEQENKYEYANLRANYFFTIFVLLTYIILETTIKDGESIKLFNYNFDKLTLFLIISTMLLIFNIKNIYTYSQCIIRKYVFKIKS